MKTQLGIALTLSGLMLGAAGCTGDATGLVEDYTDLVSALKQETQSHGQLIADASTMGDMDAEEERHSEAMATLMEDLDATSGELDACGGMEMGSSMMGMGYDSMSGMNSDMTDDLHAHTEAMGQAQDIDEAHEMELDYQQGMEDMSDAMVTHGDEMVPSSMSCGR